MKKRPTARCNAGASTYVKVGLADWLMLQRRSFTLRRTDMLCYLLTSSRSLLEYIAICLRTVQSVLKTKGARAHCVVLLYCVLWYCVVGSVWYCDIGLCGTVVMPQYGIVNSVVLLLYCCIVIWIGCLCSVLLWSSVWYRIVWYCGIVFVLLLYCSIVGRIWLVHNLWYYVIGPAWL